MDFRFECPHVAPSIGSPQFVGDPDLIFLRDDLADELGAVVGYLECSHQIRDSRISERFREVANDEVGHYIRLMRMIATLDPIQAEELKKQDLLVLSSMTEHNYPFGAGAAGGCKGCNPTERYPIERHRRDAQDRKSYSPDERMIECLQNAIRDELHAINAYQKQVLSTPNPSIQSLLTTIMNKEKEHVAEFTKLFYELFHE